MATFILSIVICTTGIFLSLQSFNMYTGISLQYILYIALPLIFLLLLTWHPPAVTGMVHLSPRLLVDCPLCPPLLPCTLPFPNSHPFWVFPGPNVLLIRTHPNPFPSIRHSNCSYCKSTVAIYIVNVPVYYVNLPLHF
jgi:hypothetical protein